MLGAIGSAVKWIMEVSIRVGTPPSGVLDRRSPRGCAYVHFNRRDSQCMMLSASCRLSMPGRFIPKAILVRTSQLRRA